MNERQLIREFLDQASGTCSGCGYNPCRCDALCDCCGCEICQCNDDSQGYHVGGEENDYSLDSMDHGEAHHEMELNDDGSISPHELFHHFDLNDDGVVTPQEYADHIEYHAAHPESLNKYRELSSQSRTSVPCIDSYDSCSHHLMSRPNDIDVYLKPLMDSTGSTCRESSAKALLDVLQSLINCGVFG